MQSAGVPTSVEPNCSTVAGSNPVTSAGDKADTLCVLQDRLRLSDVSVTDCCANTYVETPATTAGSAAEKRTAKKVAKYAPREPGGYGVTPVVVEAYYRQFSVTLKLLNFLGRVTADSGRVNKRARVEGALRRLSVARGERLLFVANLHAFCRAGGSAPHKWRHGAPHH